MDKNRGKQKKSIIGFEITKQEDEDILTSMVVDEEKECIPYRKLYEGNTIKRVYTDHCSIILKLLSWLEKQKDL